MTMTDDLDYERAYGDAERLAASRARYYGEPIDDVPWTGGNLWVRPLLEILGWDLDCEAVDCWCLESVTKDPEEGCYDAAARHGEYFPGPPRFDRPLAEQSLPYPPRGLPRWAR